MRTLEGNLVAKGMKVGIVCARFNEFITSKLLNVERLANSSKCKSSTK